MRDRLHVMVSALAIGLFFAGPLSHSFFHAWFRSAAAACAETFIADPRGTLRCGVFDVHCALGRTDLFAESLYMLMLFMLAVLLGQLRNLLSCCPFRVSWWAVSFPLAASSIAALRFAAVRLGMFTDAIALVLLVLATLVIAALLGRTLVGIVRGELRRLST